MAITDGLVFALPLDYTGPTTSSGPGTAWDTVANRNFLAPNVVDGDGYATFDGSSSFLKAYVRGLTQDELFPTAGQTFYAEVYLGATPTGTRGIAGCYWPYATGTSSWVAYINSSRQLRYRVSLDGSDANTVSAISTATLAANGVWYKVMFWWDGVNLHTRINDTGETGPAFAGPIIRPSLNSYADLFALNIGRWASANYFNGRMRNLRYWNRALTSDERNAVFAGTAPIPAARHGVRNVVLLLGQSNADGHGIMTDLTNPPPEQRHYYGCLRAYRGHGTLPGEITHAYAGYSYGTNTNDCSVGSDVGMAEVLNNSDWVILKNAEGGTFLSPDADEWYPGDALYEQSIEFVDARLQELTDYGDTPVVRAVVWIQGEWDATDNSAVNGYPADSYEANLTTLIAAIRSHFGKPQLPFVVWRLPSWQTYTYLATVRAAQEAVAAADPYVMLVNTDELTDTTENNHYDAQSLIDGGRETGRLLLPLGHVPRSRGIGLGLRL